MDVSKNFNENNNQREYDKIEKEMSLYNQLFDKLSHLLFCYLKNEFLNNEPLRIDSIDEEMTENSFAISFNYTDTIKMYTSNYYFVHGSIEDDGNIILGFANGNVSCLCANEYMKYSKEVLREKLNYLRFLKQYKKENQKKLIEEFTPHLECLFSGKGGYDFPLIDTPNNLIYDTSNASTTLLEYAKINDYSLSCDTHDYTNVEEIVIMGHGLESDIIYITEIFKKSTSLKKVKIYTFENEKKEEISRKIKFLKKFRN